MTDFRFDYGPRVLSGTGRSTSVPDLVPEGPVLVVTDKGVRGLGLADPMLAALGERALVFDGVEADPSAATALAAVATGREAGVTSVIGFGGGSPMDVAKVVAYLLGSGDDLDSIYGVDQAQGARLPLVLIPTTAGTGSEATPIAILTVGGAEKKGVVARPL
jgi:alcohol dehydrogenase class IV